MNFFEMLVTTASSSHDGTVTELHGCRVCVRLKDTLYARLRKIFLSDVTLLCLNLVSCIQKNVICVYHFSCLSQFILMLFCTLWHFSPALC